MSLLPPTGYASWLEYAIATMDDRSLSNNLVNELEPQWPENATGADMRDAAMSELENPRQRAGDKPDVVTTAAAIIAPPVTVPESLVLHYQGRLWIDPIRGAVYLADLADSPSLDEVLRADLYEVESESSGGSPEPCERTSNLRYATKWALA
ncbi:hypothetical protein [Nibricoccus aquaticus]|uniref:hypothetical protein n=1 Tax=Nibricoccus aquaticus TaxID=2576891 RepID=UPI0010FE1A9D|nr:hypothetical protein [Nibricoccus aquaticus]